MNIKKLKQYKRDALLGALGAFLMLVGDLCLSVIPAKPHYARNVLCLRGNGSADYCKRFCGLTSRTVLPRGMFALHMIVFQIIFVLIPDIRQSLGADVSAWDFVLSHGSGNAAICIWMLVNAVWAGNQAKNVNGEERNRMGFDSQSPKEETI